jgi:type I restriction enzyme S subunit
MNHGLSDATMAKMMGVFARFPEVERVVLYGSRAKGTYKPGSDIDLALFGDDLTPRIRDKIDEALDDLLLPYTIDLSIFEELEHAKLREHIERVGVDLYVRDGSQRDEVRSGGGARTGWQEAPLGAIADVSAGNSAPQDENLFAGGIFPFFRTSDVGAIHIGDIYESADNLNSNGIKGLRKFPKGTILFPKSGASTFLNHRVMMGVDGYVSSHLATISPKNDLVLGRYLLHFLTTVMAQDLIQEHAYPSLNLPVISEIPVNLPPLPEQQRIVGILDEAFDGIATAKANAERNLQSAQELFESHLESVFTQHGNGWIETQLGEVCDLFQGLCINAKTKHLLVENSSLPLLRIKDLRSNSAEQYVAESGWPKNAQVSASEIIYTRTGQIGLVFRGRVGILHNNCFKVKPRPALNDDYLYWWLQNPAFRARITTLAAKTAQPDITHSLFKAQPISLPPRAYQDSVIPCINTMREDTDRLAALYTRKLTALDELKQSLLHQAFTGAL